MLLVTSWISSVPNPFSSFLNVITMLLSSFCECWTLGFSGRNQASLGLLVATSGLQWEFCALFLVYQLHFCYEINQQKLYTYCYAILAYTFQMCIPLYPNQSHPIHPHPRIYTYRTYPYSNTHKVLVHTTHPNIHIMNHMYNTKIYTCRHTITTAQNTCTQNIYPYKPHAHKTLHAIQKLHVLIACVSPPRHKSHAFAHNTFVCLQWCPQPLPLIHIMRVSEAWRDGQALEAIWNTENSKQG